MSTTCTRIVVALAAAAIPVTAPPARAADAVYGGTTGDGEPIALTAAPNAARLKSAVIAWVADCGDGQSWLDSNELTPARPTPGFSPEGTDLLMTRNAKGRFKGTQALSMGDADKVASLTLTVEGKLAAKRASGTLSAIVKLMDRATGATEATCQTGTVRWAATRAPGVIFAGKTSQEQPVVVRYDARRRTVKDLFVGWSTQTCTPPGGMHFPDGFRNFPVSRTGRFGDDFPSTVMLPNGIKRELAYQLAGRLTRRAATGSLKVTMKDTDANGAQQLACDSGAITWKAVTG